MSFIFEKTKLEGVIIITPQIFKDTRGYFLESYRKDSFEKNGILTSFVQSNQSRSQSGVIRGLHFQKPPFDQAKLVQCIKGTILDFAVDIDKNSLTFGQHVGVELSESNGKMLYIPSHMAHGFAALGDDNIITYQCSNYYSKKYEGGILFSDPDINIDWQIKNPIVSEKDLQLPLLKLLSS